MEAASKKTVEELVTFAGATAKVIVVKAKETRAPVGASSVAGVTVVNDAPKVTLAATGTAASAAGKVKHTMVSAVDSAGDTASGAVERRQGAFARVTAAVGSAIEKVNDLPSNTAYLLGPYLSIF
jgi:hypothetical protein